MSFQKPSTKFPEEVRIDLGEEFGVFCAFLKTNRTTPIYDVCDPDMTAVRSSVPLAKLKELQETANRGEPARAYAYFNSPFARP